MIRLRSWEYWPFGIVQLPFFFYWLWLSFRARSFFFFTASNPGIVSGGMMGESKFEVLELIPDDLKPRTILLKPDIQIEELEKKLHTNGLSYPLVFKPDLGERGWMVKRINSTTDAQDYLKKIKIDFIAQALVDFPLEYGVYYSRRPDDETGKVTSIVGKEMLSVTGDGQASLEELILNKERAKLQWDSLKTVYRDRLQEIIPAGIKMELVSIGNHCLGTTFLDATNLITPELTQSFDRISKQINGFYFGRFDLRVKSIEDLAAGKIMILELNGCGAEPAHIYQPGYPLFKAMGVMYRHWRELFEVSAANHRRGVPYLSRKESMAIYRHVKSVMGKE